MSKRLICLNCHKSIDVADNYGHIICDICRKQNLLRAWVCKYGYIHDKKKKSADDIPSNNGPTYTPMGMLLGFRVDLNKISQTVENSLWYRDDKSFEFLRYPGKFAPPISRDIIIGLEVIGYSFVELKKFNWRLFKQDVRPNVFVILWHSLQAVIHYLIYQDRNYIWESRKEGAYWMSSLPLQDRYVVMVGSGERPTLLQRLSWIIYKKFTMKFGTAGEKNLLWLQLHTLKLKDEIKKLDIRNNIKEYFGEDHIFVTEGDYEF